MPLCDTSETAPLLGLTGGIRAVRLAEALKRYFKPGRVILVLGVSSDKDIAGIVAEAASLTGEVIAARSRHPRAAEPAVLVKEFSKWGIAPQVADSVAAAMKLALDLAIRRRTALPQILRKRSTIRTRSDERIPGI